MCIGKCNNDELKIRFKVPINYTIKQVKDEIFQRVGINQENLSLIFEASKQFINLGNFSIEYVGDMVYLKELNFSKRLIPIPNRFQELIKPKIWNVPIITIMQRPVLRPPPREWERIGKRQQSPDSTPPQLPQTVHEEPEIVSPTYCNVTMETKQERNEAMDKEEMIIVMIIGLLNMILVVLLMLWVFFVNRGHQIMRLSVTNTQTI